MVHGNRVGPTGNETKRTAKVFDRAGSASRAIREENIMTTPELFHVTSTIREFGSRKDVGMGWFIIHARPDLPFAELIEGYELASDRVYAENYLAGLFTSEQASALVAYLNQHHDHDGVETVTTRVELPVPGNIMGFGDIAVGGPEGFYRLCEEREWTLPFEVWGYYDLQQHEPEARRRGTELEL
jgi:hypothetical protein